MRTLDTSKYLYQFVGGEYNGKLWHYAALEVRNLITGYSEDLSHLRAKGVLCKRAELDNQPIVAGYYGPMWDGARYYDKDGNLKYDFEIAEADRVGEPIYVIRYESPEAYDMLSR